VLRKFIALLGALAATFMLTALNPVPIGLIALQGHAAPDHVNIPWILKPFTILDSLIPGQSVAILASFLVALFLILVPMIDRDKTKKPFLYMSTVVIFSFILFFLLISFFLSSSPGVGS
jgi:quinol-cytochrome oxidoreductase complex cytochrome b subunit